MQNESRDNVWRFGARENKLVTYNSLLNISHLFILIPFILYVFHRHLKMQVLEILIVYI